MPRKPAAGRKWVSVELDEYDYKILVDAAEHDHRSLNNFLQVQLGELAAKLDFDRLLWKASTGTTGTGTISGTGTLGTGTTSVGITGGTGTVESNPKSTELRDETRKHLERMERDKA